MLWWSFAALNPITVLCLQCWWVYLCQIPYGSSKKIQHIKHRYMEVCGSYRLLHLHSLLSPKSKEKFRSPTSRPGCIYGHQSKSEVLLQRQLPQPQRTVWLRLWQDPDTHTSPSLFPDYPLINQQHAGDWLSSLSVWLSWWFALSGYSASVAFMNAGGSDFLCLKLKVSSEDGNQLMARWSCRMCYCIENIWLKQCSQAISVFNALTFFVYNLLLSYIQRYIYSSSQSLGAILFIHK